jgi:hypothetical protein
MSNIEHYAPEDDVPDDWRPFDNRKWSREELLAEIDALNAEVAKWVGIATQRKGAVEALRWALGFIEYQGEPSPLDDPREGEADAEGYRRALAILGGR